MLLDRAFEESWWIFPAVELRIAGDILVPNILGITRANYPDVPDVPYFTSAPDWVCEVPEAQTVRLDRMRKMAKYAAAAVQHVWILDVGNAALEIYRVAGTRYELTDVFDETAPLVRAAPFEEIELSLPNVFSVTAPDPRN